MLYVLRKEIWNAYLSFRFFLSLVKAFTAIYKYDFIYRDIKYYKNLK